MGGLSREQADVRDTLAPYDLLVCVGADVLRMSVYSEVEPLPAGMPIVQIGLNDWEMGKNYPAELAVRSDVKVTLQALNPLLEAKGGGRADGLDALKDRNWSARREAARRKAMAGEKTQPIDPDFLMMRIVDSLTADTIVVNEGILSSRKLLDFLPYHAPSDFYGLASGGIGWSLPGSVGIQIAHRDRPVLTVVGDGSAMYSIQALWTAAHQKLPITYVIANNGGYRIIKQRLLSFHGNDNFIGMDFREPSIDFVGLAQSLGMTARRVTDPDDIGPAVSEALASGGPNLLDVVVDNGFGN